MGGYYVYRWLRVPVGNLQTFNNAWKSSLESRGNPENAMQLYSQLFQSITVRLPERTQLLHTPPDKWMRFLNLAIREPEPETSMLIASLEWVFRFEFWESPRKLLVHQCNACYSVRQNTMPDACSDESGGSRCEWFYSLLR